MMPGANMPAFSQI